MPTEIIELSEDGLIKNYLKERGFEAILSPPPEDAEVPYFLLQEPQESFDPSPMMFFYTGSGSHIICGCHPSYFPPGKIIPFFAEMAGFLHRDKNPNVVHPDVGRKFPVYITDPAWIPVVDMLVKKYNA